MVIPDDFEENRQRAEDAARRFAAAVAGAVEGFLEAFEEHRVGEEAQASIQTAGEVARAAAEEGRAQAQTPEMQDLGRGLKKAGTATADATRSATGAVKDSVLSAKESVQETASDVAQTVRDTADGVKRRVEHAREEVKVRADAVAETGRRAKVAPRRIGSELSGAFNAWKRGLVTSIVMGLVMAVFAIVTLVVLTIALVVGLNELVGDPQGTWLVALLYVLVVAVAYFVMRSRREATQRETARRLENSREEVRNVTAPVRSAFGGRGRAGF